LEPDLRRYKMKRVSQALVVLLSFAVVIYGQGNTFDKIRYNGGTIQTKVKPDDWGNHLTVSSEEIKLVLKDGQTLRIDPKRVTGLSYGQEAHRRVGTMVALGILLTPLALFGLFHKTRLHFVGIEFTTEDDKKSGLLLQAHKSNYRGVLMALRGATGAPVAVAEEDRKYIPTGVETVTAQSSEKADTSKAQESGKAASQPEATGTVRVTSNPEGAEVWVDGAFVGNTPGQLKLAAGKHRIRIAIEGYEEWVREVEVLAGSELTLNAALKKSDQD
jgi:hypothetical protein